MRPRPTASAARSRNQASVASCSRTIARISKPIQKGAPKAWEPRKMLSDRDIERVKAERLDRQMDITVKILAMLAIACLTLGLLAPTGNRLLPK
jgi:hypothetical protein